MQKRGLEEVDWSLLTEVIKDFPSDIAPASEDTLVVHLRMGDIIRAFQKNPVSRRAKQPFHIFYPNKLLDKIKRHLLANPEIRLIEIVTAMHFGDNEKLKMKDGRNKYCFSEKAVQRNKSILRRILSKIGPMEVSLFSGAEQDVRLIDETVCYLAKSTNVILDDGGFTKVIKAVRKELLLEK